MSNSDTTTIPNDLDSCLFDANIKPAQIAAKFGTDFLRTEIRTRLVAADVEKKAYAERMRTQRKGVAKLGKALTQSILAEVMQTPVTAESTGVSIEDAPIVEEYQNEANGNYNSQ